MRLSLASRRHRVAVIAAATCTAACSVTGVRVRSLPVGQPTPTRIVTPVKAHLADGATIVYRRGVQVTRDSLLGEGVLYSFNGRDSLPVRGFALAGVVAMEAFDLQHDYAASFLGTVATTAGVLIGTAALAVAIFGSCPTIYADSGAGLALQAESFSSSIVQLYEARDTDRLAVRPDAAGRFVLEIRNEALETHYINHLQMVEVRHEAGELVVPDGYGRPLAVSGLIPAGSARDRLGANRAREVAAADARVFRSQRRVVTEAVTGPLEDHLDIAVVRPDGDSAAVVLRLRNSLLNTVLLYDVLLGGRGAAALDWVGSELARIGPATQMGQWYQSRMGIRFAVWDGGQWRPVGRIPDAGPIAWKDVAFLVPVPAGGDSLRVRLSFLADNWRIDRLRIAARARRPDLVLLAPDSIVGADGRPDTAVLAAVTAPDGRYLRTVPGQRFLVHWNAGPLAPGGERTFLLAAQGYYTEWMRQAWLRREPVTPAGPPTDDLLRRALVAWQEQQADYERRFERSRIPVR